MVNGNSQAIGMAEMALDTVENETDQCSPSPWEPTGHLRKAGRNTCTVTHIGSERLLFGDWLSGSSNQHHVMKAILVKTLENQNAPVSPPPFF